MSIYNCHILHKKEFLGIASKLNLFSHLAGAPSDSRVGQTDTWYTYRYINIFNFNTTYRIQKFIFTKSWRLKMVKVFGLIKSWWLRCRCSPKVLGKC